MFRSGIRLFSKFSYDTKHAEDTFVITESKRRAFPTTGHEGPKG